MLLKISHKEEVVKFSEVPVEVPCFLKVAWGDIYAIDEIGVIIEVSCNDEYRMVTVYANVGSEHHADTLRRALAGQRISLEEYTQAVTSVFNLIN